MRLWSGQLSGIQKCFFAQSKQIRISNVHSHSVGLIDSKENDVCVSRTLEYRFSGWFVRIFVNSYEISFNWFIFQNCTRHVRNSSFFVKSRKVKMHEVQKIWSAQRKQKEKWNKWHTRHIYSLSAKAKQKLLKSNINKVSDVNTNVNDG